ncbi:hypothetical protein EI982_14960 [Haloplanus rallus]|jgi:hypothetical protein|uniref:Uncharacterized protein n=1 Tax=Haloplanus rallus TaxID=1816183 RepID=A0A6B9FFJ5_9EURY|nr:MULTISPECIES: hypothetical protein [Haloplanus]QGX95990.1 hypothetical protein EI982_14960 [Haloplanus rallus]
MSDILDDEAAAKLVKYIRENDQPSPHFQATMINFVWSLHQSDGSLEEIPLADGEMEEIFHSLPTDPEKELQYTE